jgi:L,D-transpeptidase YcbB
MQRITGTTFLASVLVASTFLAPTGSATAAAFDSAEPQSIQETCTTSAANVPRAARYAPAETQRSEKLARRQDKDQLGHSAVTNDPTPALQAQTSVCTKDASERYRKIAEEGGWPNLAKPLRLGDTSEEIETLRRRLAIEGDLNHDATSGNKWDEELTNAVKHFQWRAGLQQSGEVDKATQNALNVPAAIRARELAASAQRIADLKIPFNDRYIVVNIPSASVEAVESGRVAERHAAVAGDIDHRSPQLTASITGITINPTWTIPRSIVENEMIPKLRKDPFYLRRAKIHILDYRGHQVSARRIHGLRGRVEGLTFRQDPGRENSLGTLRIDMPNSENVYMHDTPAKRPFADDYRFLSHGCVRVDGIYDLANWLLHATEGREIPDRDDIVETVQKKDQRKIPLSKPVAVTWIYLDAWESDDGLVHFRSDVYNLDAAQVSRPDGQALR